MVDMREALNYLHKAREMIQRMDHPGHEPNHAERVNFLADSECFIADACGERVHYFKPQ